MTKSRSTFFASATWSLPLGVFMTLVSSVSLAHPSSSPAQARFSSNADAQAACAAVSKLELPETLSITSEFVSSGSFKPPAGVGEVSATPIITGLPAFCRARVVVAPAINVEVWLPANWNGRFLAMGSGGYAGVIGYYSLEIALRSGYATSTTDAGHVAQSVMSGDFALRNDGKLDWGAITDFAYRGIHEQTLKSKNLINAFYGKAAEYSYWSGCSGGGNQGFVQAQRYPNDYNGILSGSSAFPWDRMIPSELWPQVVMQQELGHKLSETKVALAQKAAIAACDADDGYKDGVVSLPEQCHFNPQTLVCKGADSDTCLTAAEATALKKIYEGPRTPEGEFLWYGMEPSTTLWSPLVSLVGPGEFPVTVSHWKSWVAQDPNFDWRTLDYKTYADAYKKSVRLYGPLYAPDREKQYQALKNSGSKMIAFHGWEDDLIPPRGLVDFRRRLAKEMGGDEATDKFFRLFMVPGLSHNVRGPGPNAFGNCPQATPGGAAGTGGIGATSRPLKEDADHDIFLALVRWVEQGKAPDSIVATKYVDDDPAKGVLRTRPICPYPKVATYLGTGDKDAAASYGCKLL